MKRSYYSETISKFVQEPEDSIIGKLSSHSHFDITTTQITAWQEEIRILKRSLEPYRRRGKIYLEYEIPRLGGRIDALALIEGVIFVIEFKVGANTFLRGAIDQTCDYALDLKNFHETSHGKMIAPIIVATEARTRHYCICQTPQEDKLLSTILANPETLTDVFEKILDFADTEQKIDVEIWGKGRYSPTPTIIEAATALYRGHSVTEISRSDAGAKNLNETSETIAEIIKNSEEKSQKSICFVTGVPGAGKTLVGLDIATKHMDKESKLYSVFLSGNGPLVTILREALARDKVICEKQKGNRFKIGNARSEVKAFIQNIHHFRDDCIKDTQAPIEHVAIFDEAQRAWHLEKTSRFMKTKKGISNFDHSEPEFLISCLDRHLDWATIVCLVGGGQEINDGESGIKEWINALAERFPNWHVYLSPELEKDSKEITASISKLEQVNSKMNLHLSVSMRSFRAEEVSSLVGQLLDLEFEQAKETLKNINENYEIVLTRDLPTAKNWLRKNARGSERYGVVVSSRAQRLKPHAIDIRPKINPIHWFLHDKDDVRSSYYLEDVATEFDIQGLEIDWACVVWDADFRYTPEGWTNWSFKRGNRWEKIRKPELQNYQKNAYRVLLTRARQGMAIVIPNGDTKDPTRARSYYDPTFNYLQEIGFKII